MATPLEPKDGAVGPSASAAKRKVISLDGWWQIADSVQPDERPKEFLHRAPVPGLAHSATPPFADVDLFDSNGYARMYAPPNPQFAKVFNGMAVPDRELPAYSKKTPAGTSYQERDYFWYRTTFKAPARRSVAVLKVFKAQYGSYVWINGREAGGHASCFTAAFYPISSLVRWSLDNEVLIRIGAHPGVQPESTTYGIDFENLRWPPGLWDSVSVEFCDSPRIETIQVAPRVGDSQIVVQTKLKNYDDHAVRCDLLHTVREWKSVESLASKILAVELAAGEEKTVLEAIDVPDAKPWTPETPSLYVLETSTAGDSLATRFGMREFCFDTPTRRAYLNGRPYFLRGADIALHRFFDDPKSSQLPWTEEWVRKLLVTIPKRMHWNTVRAFVGAWPDRWLDIADEAGLLLQYGFPMTYQPEATPDADALIAEYSAWMRDSWNHPSIAIWDACNECVLPMLPEKVVPAVRGLDLSQRPWDCGWNPPAGPDDPVDDHPYKFLANVLSDTGRSAYRVERDFDMADLELGGGGERLPLTPLTGHAMVINEYDWLWLNRDGSPTLLTKGLYPKLPYPVETAEQRFETNAYLLAGLTEYWRAHRHYAGVLYYAYLLSSHPWAAVSDNFLDIEHLRLNPYFEAYVSEAFKPLGLYVNFWQRTVPIGEKRQISIMMANDEGNSVRGTLELVLEGDGDVVISRRRVVFAVAAYGQETYLFDFEAPARVGKCVMKAIAAEDGMSDRRTVSRRHVEVVPRPES